MTGKIPQTFIDEVLQRIDIVALIEQYVPLTKKGTSFLACCPFHQEKTPSFSVSSPKQIYHCFGCGVGGNAIRFLMSYEGLSFVDAMRSLALRAGLNFQEQAEGENRPQQKLYDIMQRALQYYCHALKHSPHAIAYLKKRGLTGELAKTFQLGFAPAGWNHLTDALGKEESTKKLLLQTGLIIQKENGNFYDRFRSRIIFPIRDTQGRVIAFGGRVLSAEEPKYLNSPETALFHKGREWYGLYEARQSQQKIDYFIVVEGYMDVLALAQHGILNVVGSLGTACTSEQIAKLLRYTQRIIFCFDGDSAGFAAAWRALQVALPLCKEKVNLSFIFLPNKEDPDSFVRKQGTQSFLNLVKSAVPLSDFFFRHLMEAEECATMEGKARLSHEASRLLEKMPEGALKQMMFENLSSLVSLDTVQLRRLMKPSKIESGRVVRERGAEAPSQLTLTPLRMALLLLLQHPELSALVASDDVIDEWQQPESHLLKELVTILKAELHISPAALLAHWRDLPEYDLIAGLMIKEHHIAAENIQTEFLKLLKRLALQHKEMQIERMLVKAKTQGMTEAEKVLLQEWISALKQD